MRVAIYARVSTDDKGQVRLCARYWRLTAAGKPPVVCAKTAIAREMVGFIWAIAHRVDCRAYRNKHLSGPTFRRRIIHPTGVHGWRQDNGRGILAGCL